MYLRLRDFRWFNQKMNSLLIMMEWLISFTEDWTSMETWACISVYNYFWFQGRLCSNWRVVTAVEAEKKKEKDNSNENLLHRIHTIYWLSCPYSLHWHIALSSLNLLILWLTPQSRPGNTAKFCHILSLNTSPALPPVF